MRLIAWLGVILLFLMLMTTPACCVCGSLFAIEESENPPATLQEADLAGTWQASYAYNDADVLVIRADGTFKQTYERAGESYVYETPWNRWWLERFPDGRVRLHLEGARYYFDGVEIAEEEGLEPTVAPGTPDLWAFHGGPPPFLFYDPFARYTDDGRVYFVEMAGKLVLNVRTLPSGELVLAHMWHSSEEGFGDSQLFRRVDTSSPPRAPVP